MRRLSHKLEPRVWGVQSLAPYFDNPGGGRIGEVWFETVPELPLLVKFLFTSEKLSVQVHPDDRDAQQHGHPRGKTEMWHILSAEPGAKIAAGFREELAPERVRAAAESGEIMDLLAWHEAKPGDIFFIPAGTVHAIGEGLTLCEIQQLSDVTYRMFDYGRPRELHLDDGLRVSHRGPSDVRRGGRVECPQFTVDRIEVDGTLDAVGERSSLWIAIAGSGNIDGEPVKAGEAWFAPPRVENRIRGKLTFLLASEGV